MNVSGVVRTHSTCQIAPRLSSVLCRHPLIYLFISLFFSLRSIFWFSTQKQLSAYAVPTRCCFHHTPIRNAPQSWSHSEHSVVGDRGACIVSFISCFFFIHFLFAMVFRNSARVCAAAFHSVFLL